MDHFYENQLNNQSNKFRVSTGGSNRTDRTEMMDKAKAKFSNAKVHIVNNSKDIMNNRHFHVIVVIFALLYATTIVDLSPSTVDFFDQVYVQALLIGLCTYYISKNPILSIVVAIFIVIVISSWSRNNNYDKILKMLEEDDEMDNSTQQVPEASSVPQILENFNDSELSPLINNNLAPVEASMGLMDTMDTSMVPDVSMAPDISMAPELLNDTSVEPMIDETVGASIDFEKPMIETSVDPIKERNTEILEDIDGLDTTMSYALVE